MTPDAIRKKVGGDYVADERTFILGIDRRFTAHFAARFAGRRVVETCTGAGFTTISLARTAAHVLTVEIDADHQAQAVRNVEIAGLSDRVSFVLGSVLDQALLDQLPPFDAAFIDPDWAVTGPDHQFRFINSNTRPPADTVLQRMLERTGDIALIQPPLIDPQEFRGLCPHEQEKLYLGESHELYCLYFGNLAETTGETVYRVPV